KLAVTSPPELKAWADGLLNKLRPLIKAVAEELLSIQKEGSLPSDAEAASACVSAAGADFTKLKAMSDELLRRLVSKKRLATSIIGIQQAIVGSLNGTDKPFPSNIKAALGKDAIV